MIPGSKLTDIWGRRVCFIAGLVVYGAGALLAALAQNLTTLTIGYSLLKGIGSALLIPPIYILVTVLFQDIRSRAKYFGVVSGAGGVGAAAGPLIGGLITSYISWREVRCQIAEQGDRHERSPAADRGQDRAEHVERRPLSRQGRVGEPGVTRRSRPGWCSFRRRSASCWPRRPRSGWPAGIPSGGSSGWASGAP